MKKILLKSLLVAAGLSASVQVMAEGYDFYVDGIFYNVTSKENLTVEVTDKYGYSDPTMLKLYSYSGDVVIPNSVTWNDTTYSVTKIGNGAMAWCKDLTSVYIPASVDTIGRNAISYERESIGPRNPIKVTIEYSEKPLYCSNYALVVDSVIINRDLKFFDSNGWGFRIIPDAYYVEFGDSLSTINSHIVSHNQNLKEVRFPNHSFSFNVFVTDEATGWRSYGIFEGCTSLEKIDLSNLIPFSSSMEWEDYGNGNGAYTDLGRNTQSYFITPMAFRGCISLKEVILPDTIMYERNVNLTSYNTAVGSMAFEGCSSLQNIDLPVFTGTASTSRYQLKMGYRAFSGTAITSVELPASISRIEAEAFADCASLTYVRFPNEWEWKKPTQNYDYSSSTTLYLGNYTFKNCTALKTIEIGPAVTYIPETTFDGCAIENISFSGALTYLSTDGLKSRNIKSIYADPYNSVYSLKDNMLTTYIDGNTWLLTVGNPYTGATTLKNDTVNILGAYLYDGLPIESFDFPAVYNYGNRSLAGTNIKSVHIKDTICYIISEETYTNTVMYGTETFADCKLLEECTIDPSVTKLAQGLFKNCSSLATAPEIPAGVSTIPAEIFFGTAISEITLGEKVNLFSENALPAGMTDITLYASIPPTVAETDSVEWISNTTIVVPSTCVEMYAQHKFWGRAKAIIGNSDFAGHGYSGYIQPAPDGLYFSVKDGNICYYDGENVVDTYIPSGSHPFQLASWHGAIYCVDAGENYYYQNDADNTLGDGELFVVNKRETGFSRTTIVNNRNQGDGANYHAFNDPFLIYIDDSEDKIYYANRNLTTNYSNDPQSGQGIRVFDAAESYDTPYQTSAEVPLFVCANNMPYYNMGIAYGAIPNGFQKDSEGVYWHAFRYSGNGIYRYKSSDIYQSSKPYPIIANGSRFSAMYLDEKNDYIYVFSTTAANHGVYRMRISAIRSEARTNFPSEWELIDNSQADAENNTADEGVYVRQFTSDGNYVYWAYRTDGSNPNSPSGIKRVNATGTPVVEYVVKDVEAYGICHYKYDGSLGVESVIGNESVTVVSVKGNTITALQTTDVAVYSINGAMVEKATLPAGSTLTINYTPGIYIVKAGAETHKIVIK